MKHLNNVVAMVFTVLLLTACGSAAVTNAPADTGPIVELDIFSGRPNPRWELDEAAADRLDFLVRSLSPAPTVGPEPQSLGYRGFIFDAGGEARAFKGFVQTRNGVLADPTRSVESYLLEQLPDEYADLRPSMAPEIEVIE